MITDRIAAAAARLREAEETATPCAPVRDLIGGTDVSTAYAVASVNVARRVAEGSPRIGRKIGLTSEAVQRQLRVDQPDFGSLLSDMVMADGGTVAPGALLQPRVEGEIAFVLSRHLDGSLESVGSILAAIESAHAAIEIVDSRIAAWDITIADTVADNASSGLCVLGASAVDLAGLVPRDVEMTLTVNGAVQSSGSGTACLGDPLLAVLWLARASRDVGDPLRAGEVVLSGALGPMVPVEPGDQVTVDISGLGEVAVRFGEREVS